MILDVILCGLFLRMLHEKQGLNKSFAEAFARPSQSNQKRIFG